MNMKLRHICIRSCSELILQAAQLRINRPLTRLRICSELVIRVAEKDQAASAPMIRRRYAITSATNRSMSLWAWRIEDQVPEHPRVYGNATALLTWNPSRYTRASISKAFMTSAYFRFIYLA